MSRSALFEYGGYQFLCSAQPEGPAMYQPVLLRRLPWPSEEEVLLLSDADPCRTEAEALWHAQVQAMKWVDARTPHELLQT
jgi:hypothetical protein